MDKEELALLVQFVTGTSKVPLEGFKALQARAPPPLVPLPPHSVQTRCSRMPVPFVFECCVRCNEVPHVRAQDSHRTLATAFL